VITCRCSWPRGWRIESVGRKLVAHLHLGVLHLQVRAPSQAVITDTMSLVEFPVRVGSETVP
jgi:hypothetical protein